ncbi:MAG: HAD-IA family hydrolase [Bacilli bacterium]|nr:HAD-IA family hydrolase [Bacilli bacterium]
MKNIVFDIGNICFYYDISKLPGLFSDDIDEQKFIIDNLINSPEWQTYDLIDTGLFNITDIINIHQDRTDHLKDKLIFNFWHHYLDSGYISSDVLLLIKNLSRNGYKIYLLSNMNDSFYNKVESSGLFDMVDGYVLSFQECALKPHTEIYKILIDRYDLKVDETLFIDDLIANVDTAKMLGMTAEVVEKDNYNDLLDKLKKNNINVE